MLTCRNSTTKTGPLARICHQKSSKALVEVPSASLLSRCQLAR